VAALPAGYVFLAVTVFALPFLWGAVKAMRFQHWSHSIKEKSASTAAYTEVGKFENFEKQYPFDGVYAVSAYRKYTANTSVPPHQQPTCTCIYTKPSTIPNNKANKRAYQKIACCGLSSTIRPAKNR
jgi:hypothetical protein